MDIDEIRRANICLLEQRVASPTMAADRVGMSYSQYLNYRNGAKEAKTGKLRGMRKETAWRFEDAFRVPRGWLDQPHGEPTDTLCDSSVLPYPVLTTSPRALVRTLCELAEQINDDGLRELIGFAR